MIHRTDDHLPWRWLADHADGLLAPAQAGAARDHLAAGCSRCCARDRSVRRMVAAIGAGPLDAPPASADRRVVALFPRLRSALRPQSGVLFGALVLDQRADLLLAVRSGAPDGRRLLWTVGDYEIDASVVGSEGRIDVLGQVVRADGDAAVTGEVRVVRGRRAVAASRVAADGRFTFRALSAGACVVEGTLDGRAFSLPLLVLD